MLQRWPLGVLPALMLAVTPCTALTLARGGQATAQIRVAREAGSAERTAARELAHYLALASGARFEIVSEEEPRKTRVAILVGPPRAALGPEEWVVRTEGPDLLLYGGSPRGTLYAVYRFLEDELGVRWWTPFEQSVPPRHRIRVGALNERGEPVFVYRDLFGLVGPARFRARHRLNGHFSRLGPEYGGSERYGPPRHVHNFHDYVPPEEFLLERPELFSEIAGLRSAGRAQLCLSEPGTFELVRSKLVQYIGESRVEAARQGTRPPRLFSFSQNDWRGTCECDRCRSASAAYGSAAGPLVELMNRLADSIRQDHPDILLDTLAYMATLAPPEGASLPDNVVVRLSALQRRDFSIRLGDPLHAALRAAIEGWVPVATHLRIWDYAVTYGEHGEFPLPNLPIIADDLRYYRDLGVDGVFFQLDFPLASDMRDLKRWVLLELIEDPTRDVQALIADFTRGYYGKAGRPIRRYLRALGDQVAAHPARIGFEAAAADFTYLDAPFLLRAHRLFDAAERSVAGNPLLTRRVRRARLTLDRSTLWRWERAFGDGRESLDRRPVVRRYRETWYAQIGTRVPADGQAAARAEVDREIAFLDARFEE